MRSYHHGSLRGALLNEAAAVAAESGAESVRLRELARRLKVSHAAPTHHFRTRQDLLTALAIQGFDDLARALATSEGDVYDLGVDYVQWALAHPGSYLAMWQPRLLDESDPLLIRARETVWTQLTNVLSQTGDGGRLNAHAAFALVHGVSSLLLSGVPPLDRTSETELRQLLGRFQPLPSKNGA